jgi:hypothetical protein
VRDHGSERVGVLQNLRVFRGDQDHVDKPRVEGRVDGVLDESETTELYEILARQASRNSSCWDYSDYRLTAKNFDPLVARKFGSVLSRCQY